MSIQERINALWADIEGFEKPECESCCVEACLDFDGFYCPECYADIPNGQEFDDLLAEHQRLIDERDGND